MRWMIVALGMLSAGCGSEMAVDAGEEDAPPLDAPADAGTDAPRDVGTDGGLDAPDAPLPDARLFATRGGSLVTFDLATGAETVIGPSSPTAYAMAAAPEGLLGLVTEGDGARLVEIDPCTGDVTPGPLLMLASAPAARPEGLTYHDESDGLYVALSLDGADFTSETLASLDASSGAVSPIGRSMGTLGGGDADLLTTGGGEVIGADAHNSKGWSTQVFVLDPATGAATLGPTSPGLHLATLAVSPEGDAYGWDIDGTSPHSFLRLDLETGAVTTIGELDRGDDAMGFVFLRARCP